MPDTPLPLPTVSPKQALQRLIDGNQRFRNADVAGTARPWSSEMAKGQRPFAIILGCSDSRTPVEIVFDQGFGDLFVVRVAGNIVAPSIVGSIEFAASQFESGLVVVMGHTRCGAVTATVRALLTGENHVSKNIRSITDRISPHIRSLVKKDVMVGDSAIREAVRANVRASADHLRHGSSILEDLVMSGKLAVVCAEYELETGAVTFFDALPE